MILGIDTTNDWTSIALDGQSVVWRGDRNQSRDLLPRIEKLMKKNKSSFDDLEGVVVVNGPGSYTGIRIGVSVANTIGMLCGVSVKGVDGLLAQAKLKIINEKLKIGDGEILSLISAGGGRVYGRRYKLKIPLKGSTSLSVDKVGRKNEKLKIEENGRFFVGQICDFVGKVDKENYIVGELNEEVENWIKSTGFEHFEMLNEKDKRGRAWATVKMWEELPEEKNNIVLPMYLREAVR